jgi:cell division protein ZapA
MKTASLQSVTKRCKVEAEIMGESYQFAASSEPEYLRQLAHEVDTRMREIALDNPQLGPMRIAMLALLQLAAEVKEVETLLENKDQQIASRLHAIEREIEQLLGVA